MSSWLKVWALSASVVVAALTLAGAASADDALWRALQTPGHIALLRHAIAPGFGDPDDFKLGDCATQRNLSDEGRRQAERIGERFRRNGIRSAHVYSSQWCRCLETARRLELGRVEELPILNSFFEHAERRDPQTEGLEHWLRARGPAGVTVLVTHQVNITALTDVYPASGELVVVRVGEDGGVSVAGTITTE